MTDGQSILIVDSNQGFAALLKESLEQDGGYHANVTTNGDDALQAISAIAYDLAIVDLGLENPDGVSLARTMRRQRAELRLMLIPIQGEELPPELSDLDIQGVLPKPFFLPELSERITDALAKPVMPDTGSSKKKPRTDRKATTGPTSTQSVAADTDRSAVRDAEPMTEVRDHIPQIIQNMSALAQEVSAAAVLLTCKGRLISHTGHISIEEAVGLAQATTENWRTAARVAQILGQDLSHFEQSTEGGEHTFYSLTVIEDIILSIALNAHVPLGMIRHRAKETADTLRTLLNSTQ